MKKDRIFWAIVFILGAIGLIFRAVKPDLAIFTLPIWKWLIGALLLNWLINNVVFGETLARHLDVFFPLALMYILIRPELAEWTNTPLDNMVQWWIVLLIAALLHMANHLILDLFRKPKGLNIIHGEVTEDHEDEEPKAQNNNRFSSSAVYLNATKESHYVMNRFGQQVVYFQNTDVENLPETMELKVDNAFGQTIIHVPSDWAVKNDVDSAMGNVTGRIRDTGKRTLHLVGKNRFGELLINQD
ncbi:MAG: hypothetical protein II710_05200 [Clostridia bacterium]|nr:hypothetical protein [Clostridia bacterium]